MIIHTMRKAIKQHEGVWKIFIIGSVWTFLIVVSLEGYPHNAFSSFRISMRLFQPVEQFKTFGKVIPLIQEDLSEEQIAWMREQFLDFLLKIGTLHRQDVELSWQDVSTERQDLLIEYVNFDNSGSAGKRSEQRLNWMCFNCLMALKDVLTPEQYEKLQAYKAVTIILHKLSSHLRKLLFSSAPQSLSIFQEEPNEIVENPIELGQTSSGGDTSGIVVLSPRQHLHQLATLRL